jgi:hypothetical protein
VSCNADVWNVRFGLEGERHLFPTEAAALTYSAIAARLLWIDEGTPSGIKVITAEGDWAIHEVFGLERPTLPP